MWLHFSTDMNATDPEAAAWNSWFDGQLWAKPSVTHLRELMRHVVTHPQDAAAKGQAARQYLLNRFSSNVMADRILSEIERIQTKLKAAGKHRGHVNHRPLPSRRGASTISAATAVLTRPMGPGSGAIPTTVRPQGVACMHHPQLCSGGSVPAALPTQVEEMLAHARQVGFTHAGGTSDTSTIDTTAMTLKEIMQVLDRPKKPRTVMRQQHAGTQQPHGLGGQSGEEAKQRGSNEVGGVELAQRQEHHGWTQPHDLGWSAQPLSTWPGAHLAHHNGLEPEEDDDDSIVLHAF